MLDRLSVSCIVGAMTRTLHTAIGEAMSLSIYASVFATPVSVTASRRPGTEGNQDQSFLKPESLCW